MNTFAVQTEQFHKLHIPGQPLILMNVWDAGSAITVEQTGAQALATGSWAVAHAHGYEDSEQLAWELVLANVQHICRVTHTPVTIDIESGYGVDPDMIGRHVLQVIAYGAVGINLEDRLPDGQGLYSITEQSERLRAARYAGNLHDGQLFINARTDLFFQNPTDAHSIQHIDQALERAQAYAEAGANGLFVPGLSDLALIEALCKQSPLPINVMVNSEADWNALAQCGVARISYGPAPYLQALQTLKQMAQQIYDLPLVK
ncbi:isocitrate lyase/PEP mutase family protein [Paenibacillus kandeliae]|uniref:isocitrate lyase/PEP mutase family protein n=1 Tax=Paenibacillus kandeliae TaxID=3231269 RepID=UPI00345783E6